jgi:hypothetical protein
VRSDPAELILGAVDSCLDLAATWDAWDGRPRVSEATEDIPEGTVFTPHKAIRRIADHLVGHLAQLEVLLAGAEPIPDTWHGRTRDPGHRLGAVYRGRPERGRQPAAPAGPGLCAAAAQPRRGGAGRTPTAFLLFAAGPKFILVSFIIYAPATILFVMARREQGRQLFSPAELVILAVSVLANGFTDLVVAALNRS